ncbi:MAG TPA: c-type cytochrome [Lysobacter sp.]
MSHARVLGILGIAVFAVAAVAYAQTTITPIPDNAPVATAPLDNAPVVWGDVKAGATKAGTCAACHGLDGNPADPQYPRLAGMPERYLAKQIALFRSGERSSGMAAIMMPFASMLSPQDARDIGAYYATQKAGAGVADDTLIATGPNAGKPFYAVGEQLYRSGDAARGIPACMACHGPDGAGNPGPAYPQLAGQQSAYAARRLEEYRAGTTAERDPAHFQIMATIAKSLTDEEIGSLASYLQGLHPRSHEAIAGTAPAAPAAAPAAPAPAPATPAPVDAAPTTPDAEATATPAEA